MTKENIYRNLNKIFCEVFDNDEIVINETTSADDIEDWDSFEHINLIVAIEHEFGIKFEIKEAKGFANVGEMVNAIMAKMKN